MKQHEHALAKANLVRKERARIKQDIKDGHTTVIDVLAGRPFVCDTMTISELLMCQQQWGVRKVRKLLQSLPYTSGQTKLKNLTDRQRKLIVLKLQCTE